MGLSKCQSPSDFDGSGMGAEPGGTNPNKPNRPRQDREEKPRKLVKNAASIGRSIKASKSAALRTNSERDLEGERNTGENLHGKNGVGGNAIFAASERLPALVIDHIIPFELKFVAILKSTYPTQVPRP